MCFAARGQSLRARHCRFKWAFMLHVAADVENSDASKETKSCSCAILASSFVSRITRMAEERKREKSKFDVDSRTRPMRVRARRPLLLQVTELAANSLPFYDNEPGTPLSCRNFQYTKYTSRYNWRDTSSNSHFDSDRELGEQILTTKYTVFHICPRSPSSQPRYYKRKEQTNYRTSYRTRAKTNASDDPTWYTSIHIWSTQNVTHAYSPSPTLSPVRKICSIEEMSESKMSPRPFSL